MFCEPQRQGTPLDAFNVSKQFKALLKAAELAPLRIHDLRHSCATLLLAQGVNARTIMETLGHSQISLTLNTYSHVLPELQREAAAKLNGVLGSQGVSLGCQRWDFPVAGDAGERFY